MIHALFSELRTIYETTPGNPHTFRLTIKMKDMVREAVLQQAVRLTMERYPYFRVRLAVHGGEFTFEDNDMPVPVLHRDEPVLLASEETAGHLLVYCWWKNKIHIDCYHALTDGGGIYPMLKTFLYYYCSLYYGRQLANDNIRLAEDPVDPLEWADPAREKIETPGILHIPKWRSPAFQLRDSKVVRLQEKCIVFNIRIPEDEFMSFNLSNDGSPSSILALLLARAIDQVHPDKELPTVIAVCVNQRPMLRAPLAHQSLVGDARLVYDERIKKLPFSMQETCFRGRVSLQTDADPVLEDIKQYQQLMSDLKGLTMAERHARCVADMDNLTACLTATVSYTGKGVFGDAEYYVQEFHALPSTALPSSATPLTLELSAVNGSFYVNFLQYFEEQDILDAFIGQLREGGINYDVLYQETARYPGMPDLFSGDFE